MIAQHKSNPVASTEADQKRDLAIDRRQAVEAIIRETKAASLKGAIVQIMLASASADFIAAATAEDWGDEVANMQKLLYSAAMALEVHIGVDRRDFGGWFYMPENFDPFDWQQAENRAA